MPDYPDLPPVSQDPDVPLPDVAPNSDLVPYRIGRKPEGGEYQYTTGYAPRARPPIQPPQGMGIGGAGAPDLGPLIGEAFQRLPVDQALKAVEVASRYIGQRGYMKDLESGQNAAQAFAKWGPMLFRTAVGIPEAIDRSVPTPITPQQMIQNRLNQVKFQAAQEAAQSKLASAKAKAEEGELRTVGSGLYRVKPGQKPEELVAPKPLSPYKLTEEQKADLQDAYSEGREARKDMAKLASEAIDSPEVADARNRMREAATRISKITSKAKPDSIPNPATPTPVNPAQPLAPVAPVAQDKITTKAQFDALPSGTVYTGKDGKKYRKP